MQQVLAIPQEVGWTFRDLELHPLDMDATQDITPAPLPITGLIICIGAVRSRWGAR